VITFAPKVYPITFFVIATVRINDQKVRFAWRGWGRHADTETMKAEQLQSVVIVNMSASGLGIWKLVVLFLAALIFSPEIFSLIYGGFPAEPLNPTMFEENLRQMEFPEVVA
jgi:hypothetical protein